MSRDARPRGVWARDQDSSAKFHSVLRNGIGYLCFKLKIVSREKQTDANYFSFQWLVNRDQTESKTSRKVVKRIQGQRTREEQIKQPIVCQRNELTRNYHGKNDSVSGTFRRTGNVM